MNNFILGHFGQDLGEGLIAVGGDVVIDVAWVVVADVFEDDADFFLFGRANFVISQIAHLCGVVVQLTTLDEMLLNNQGNTFRSEGDVVAAFRINQNIGSFRFRFTKTGGVNQLDFIQQVLSFQFGNQLLFYLNSALINADGVH